MRNETVSAKISCSDISVVVQGPVIHTTEEGVAAGLTARCLESIRRHLPGAEIILSTWKGERTNGLEYDALVESDDPGAQKFHYRLPLLNNVNRQIVSTIEGLKRANRIYAVKVRSDIEFVNSGFLDYFGKYQHRCEQMKLLQERIVNCTNFAQNPHRHHPTPFHPSDWFMFGLREDLIRVWDIPLAPKLETSRWFERRPRPNPDISPHLLHRFFPEQYMWLSFLRKYSDVNLDHMWDCTQEILEASELSFANNLIFLEPEKIGIRSQKYRITLDDWAALYTHSEWERLYKRYCCPDFRLNFSWAPVWKNMYYLLRFLSPERTANALLRCLIHSNQDFLLAWERRSPHTFQLAKSLFNKLT